MPSMHSNTKTFNDLEFKPHPGSTEVYDLGIVSRLFFPNGYGVSVVKGKYTYGGPEGLYELAVLDSNGSLTYETPITDDVIGHLSENQVTNIMKRVQEL